MSNLVFPHIIGSAWKFKKRPRFENLKQPATAPGFETRLSLGPDPLYEIDLEYVILKAGSLGSTLSQLEGFFKARRGDFDSFLIDLGDLTKNPSASSVTDQALTPVAGVAPIQITEYVSAAENYQENIYELAGVNGNPGVAPIIRKNGTPLTSGSDYTIHGPGYAVAGASYTGLVAVLTTSTAGATFTTDFSWLYRVRFAQPLIELEMFFYLLWRAQQVQLVSTRTQ